MNLGPHTTPTGELDTAALGLTMSIERRIAADRAARGLPRTSPRDVLLALAIQAGYTFTEMGAQLRSGIGDERPDLPGGSERVALNLRASHHDDGQPCEPGGETLLDRAMRDA